MNYLLYAFIAMAAMALCLGFYFHWFRISPEQARAKDKVAVMADRERIQMDEQITKTWMRNMRQHVTGDASIPGEK